MNDFIAADNRILQDPAPLWDSHNWQTVLWFAVRVWVDGPDYWNVFFEMN
jgi:small conductance mechanosensitive channel